MNKRWKYIVISLILIALIISGIFLKRYISNTPDQKTPADTHLPAKEAVPTVFQYIKIDNACDWSDLGTCVNMRTGPGTEFPIVSKLRNGVVLKVSESIVSNGLIWYKIDFDTWLRYPERAKRDLYVAGSDSVHLFTDIGDEETSEVRTSTNKRIVVDLSEEMLYAYDGNKLFMKEAVSTGLELTHTPRGTFFVFKKTPTRYMQGPIPGISDQYYDLPGVPWDLYFTQQGAVIHGAYWHNKFGEPWSHGCVNLPPEKAEQLYKWADLGMPVTVQN